MFKKGPIKHDYNTMTKYYPIFFNHLKNKQTRSFRKLKK